jgi:hypothetical protein
MKGTITDWDNIRTTRRFKKRKHKVWRFEVALFCRAFEVTHKVWGAEILDDRIKTQCVNTHLENQTRRKNGKVDWTNIVNEFGLNEREARRMEELGKVYLMYCRHWKMD